MVSLVFGKISPVPKLKFIYFNTHKLNLGTARKKEKEII